MTNRTPIKTDLGGLGTFFMKEMQKMQYSRFRVASMWLKTRGKWCVNISVPRGFLTEKLQASVWTNTQIQSFQRCKGLWETGKLSRLRRLLSAFCSGKRHHATGLHRDFWTSRGRRERHDDACWEVKRRERSWAECAGNRSKAPFPLFIPPH